MRLLLTAFEPFGGSSINPSQEVVRVVEQQDRGSDRSGMNLSTLVLPVDAELGPQMLLQEIDRRRPNCVICLGESSKATAVTLERVFVNLADYRIADNAGRVILNQPIVPNGPAAYFSTLPIEPLSCALNAARLQVSLSLSAGAFLCNHVSYAMLHHIRRRRSVRAAGFVHLPRLPEQVVDARGEPSMPLAESARAVQVIIRAMQEWWATPSHSIGGEPSDQKSNSLGR